MKQWHNPSLGCAFCIYKDMKYENNNRYKNTAKE